MVIYDVDPATQPEEILAGVGSAANVAAPGASGQGSPGDRLGSTLTDTNGYFELTYEDAEFRIRNTEQKRPDLSLMVMAPEEAGKDPNSRMLYASAAIRQNAGLTEQYLIRLTADQLEKAGVPLHNHSR